jgi:hypothetical protein
MRTVLGLAVAALCMLAPAAASAGQLYVDHPWSFVNDDFVRYEAAPGETNLVSASFAAGGRIVNVYDAGAQITTPLVPEDRPYEARTLYPCEVLDPHHGRCYIPDPRSIAGQPDCLPDCTAAKLAGAYGLTVDLADGDDAYTTLSTSDPFSAFVSGGAGDDRIILHNGPASGVSDLSGHNVIRVGYNSDPPFGPGAYWISGGSGPDEIYAANGSYNDIYCSYDTDTVVADAIDLVEPTCENVTRR